MVFGLTTVSSLAGDSLLKGTISTVFGLMLATMGIDLPTGLQRYTFGVDKLMEGFDIIVAAIGLFAIPEILMALEEISAGTLEQIKVSRIWLSMRDLLESVGAILRGTVLGFLVGAVPGAAHVTASFFSYALEKKLSPHPERFGKGEIRGVAGPESANNAAASGALLPLLTLGLPASTVTAVLWSTADGRGEAQPVPLPTPPRRDLGPRCQHVRRQHHAAHPQPPAGRDLRSGSSAFPRAGCFRLFW